MTQELNIQNAWKPGRYRPLLCGLTFCLVLIVSFGTHAAVKVFPDRNEQVVNESFRLTFEVDEKVDAEPDFSPLERDFDILGRSQRSSISMINGQFSKSTVWVLNVMPKHAGNVKVPAIDFGSSKSQELDLIIKDAGSSSGGAGGNTPAVSGDEHMRLEFDVAPRDPYVQQQVLYTVRLVRSVDVEINDASLSEPKLQGGTAIVQQLGKDKVFNRQRGGEQQLVVERSYAVFPQQSGPVTIEPVTFQGQVVYGSATLFDPFAQSVRTKQLHTDPIKLTVRPIPKSFSGKVWLPAKSLQLREIWSKDPPEFKLNEPITRTLGLIASGLTAGQLPELSPAFDDGLKAYPEQPALQDQKKSTGVAGIREEKVQIIPSKPGMYVLPALTIPWWNTETDRQEQVELPERQVAIAGTATAPTDAGPPADAQPKSVEPTPLPAAQPLPAAADRNGAPTIWPWLACVLTLAWLGTLCAWWRDRTRLLRRVGPAITMHSIPDTTTLQDLKQKVNGAARSNDPQATKAALLAWAARRWPRNCPTALGALAKQCGAELGDEVQKLNEYLYRHRDSAGPWTGGNALVDAFARYDEADKTAAQQSPQHGLQPLHKLTSTS